MTLRESEQWMRCDCESDTWLDLYLKWNFTFWWRRTEDGSTMILCSAGKKYILYVIVIEGNGSKIISSTQWVKNGILCVVVIVVVISYVRTTSTLTSIIPKIIRYRYQPVHWHAPSKIFHSVDLILENIRSGQLLSVSIILDHHTDCRKIISNNIENPANSSIKLLYFKIEKELD